MTLLFVLLALVAGEPLVARMLAGDRRAGRVVLNRLLPIIRARAWRCLRRAPRGVQRVLDVDDLTQEAWGRLLANDGAALRAYEPGKASLEGYVGMIAERAVLNAIEQQTAAKRGAGVEGADVADLPLASETPAPERNVANRDLLSKLSAFLDEALPERGQLVFRLLYTDGLDTQQVARTLGVTDQVVYNWRHKIRKLTAEFMAES